MKPNPWPDFLFTIAVRFFFGVLVGGVVCLLFSWRGVLWAFSRNHTHWPIVWLALCALAGGFVAIFTIPRWQTPWYKRDPDELSVVKELVSQNPKWSRPQSNVVVKKTVSIKMVGPDGEEHEYSSMEDVPPEVRAQLESLEKEKGTELSVEETSRQGNTFTSKVIRRKDVSVYTVVDKSGVEQTYRSLEEMPPELRAAFEKATERLKDAR
jgi:hypothetical protein